MDEVKPKSVVVKTRARYAAKDLPELEKQLATEKRTGVLHIHYSTGGKAAVEFEEESNGRS